MENSLEGTLKFWISGVSSCAVAVIGVILNSIAAFIIRSKYQKTNIFYQMLVSLLCIDIFVLITWINLSILLAFEANNPVVFNLFPYLSMPLVLIAITASTFMTVAIAHERYLAVKAPMKYSQYMKTPSLQAFRLKIYIIIVLVLSVAVNAPHFFEYEVRYVSDIYNGTHHCNLTTYERSKHQQPSDNAEPIADSFSPYICNTEFGENPFYVNYYRNLAKLLLTGIVPFILLIFFNAYIYKSIRNRRSGRASLFPARISTLHQSIDKERSNPHIEESLGLGLSSRKPTNTTRCKEEDNLTLVFFGIVSAFLLCHSLKIGLNFCDGVFGKVGSTTINRILGHFSNFLVVLNSAINMIIYCLLNIKFRQHLFNAIRCKSR